jgi:Fe-S-cluster containining protein
MLTAPQRQALQASVERVRRRVGQALAAAQGTVAGPGSARRPPGNMGCIGDVGDIGGVGDVGGVAEAGGADAALDVVALLHTGLDTVAARAAADGPAPDCRPGCAHCCRRPVEATDPEVLRLARAVRGWPAPERAALHARLRAHRPGQACAFLRDERCSVYALRPGVCRKAHSLSVQACAAGAAEIPQRLDWIVDAEALMAGTALAYRDAGLPAAARELNAAVARALDDATCEARWQRGEDALGALPPMAGGRA